MLEMPSDFSFVWWSISADSAREAKKNVRDFKSRWQARPAEFGNLNFEGGKCVGYLLWVELTAETIPLPQK